MVTLVVVILTVVILAVALALSIVIGGVGAIVIYGDILIAAALVIFALRYLLEKRKK